MCDPATIAIATFATGAAQQIVSYQAQNAEHKAAQVAAREAAAIEQRDLTTRQIQEQESKAQKDHLALIDDAKAKASAEVQATGSGIAGVSVDNIIGEIGRETNNNLVTYEKNWEMTANQLQREKDATIRTAQSRAAQSPKPNPAGLVAGLVGSGLGAYGKYKRM